MEILYHEHFLIFVLATAAINTMAAMSPGPDTLLVMRSSLHRGYSYAIWVSFGIFVAVLGHMLIVFSGMIYVIKTMPVVLQIIGGLGALYLSYLGYLCLSDKSGFDGRAAYTDDEELQNRKGLEKYPFVIGFLANILNPKAFVFFLGVMAPLLKDNAYIFDSLFAMVFLAFMIAGCVGGWFVVLSRVVVRPKFMDWFSDNSILMNRITGAIFMAYAIIMVYNAIMA